MGRKIKKQGLFWWVVSEWLIKKVVSGWFIGEWF